MRGSRAVLVKFNNYAYSFPLGQIQEIQKTKIDWYRKTGGASDLVGKKRPQTITTYLLTWSLDERTVAVSWV